MREIPSREWGTFCQRLNEFEHGAMTDIFWIDRETKVEREVARSVQLDEIAFGRRDDCNDQITIRAGGERSTRHEIIEPIHVLLREIGDGGAYNAVAIEAEQGTTIVKFNPVIRPSWLEGLHLRGR